MAKHQHRSFATDKSPYPYHEPMHRQSNHHKEKLVTKPNLRNVKNSNRGDSRKPRNSKHESHHGNPKNQTYPNHRTPPPYSYTLPEYYYIINATEPPTLEQIAAERERVRVEFFSTYDVMTGVRIATTLGGFFGLMVFLVIYKSRGERFETMNALKDPKIAAVAAAVMQEEEYRELQEAMEATGLSIYPDDYIDPYPYQYSRRSRMSLGNVSAPPTLNQTGRFCSIGGYSSLLMPTKRRFSYAGTYRKSNSVESSRVFSAYPIDESFAMDDYYGESDGEEADDEFDQITNIADVDDRARSTLTLPQRGQGRRWSNITCCSSESSYLERRCSAITFSAMSAISSQCSSTTNIWNYFQPSDGHQSSIALKTPTHSFDRCDHKSHHGYDGGSAAANRRWKKAQRRRSIDQDSFDSTSTYPERGRRFFYDEIEEEELETTVLAQQINKLSLENRCLDDAMIKYTLNNTLQTNLLSNRRAPLASISSLKMSSIDYQDSDLRSPVSDSIFDETYADTDDDIEQFSIDSEDGMQSENATLKAGRRDHASAEAKRPRKRDTKTIVNIERTDFEVASTSGNANLFSGNTSNKYSLSTGNVTSELLEKHDKNEFSSEPFGLHQHTVAEEPQPMLHKTNSKSNVSLRMPYKTSYSSSSGRSNSSCHSST